MLYALGTGVIALGFKLGGLLFENTINVGEVLIFIEGNDNNRGQRIEDL
jgi:hypothetical protein